LKDFKDKVAVITGAARGIGRDPAERCVQEGIRVILADVETDPFR
jgi:NAD(P)-dependent dehydrogenase (short-subunit alcohol dehydrogenase family)